jgi:hypothetical protein
MDTDSTQTARMYVRAFELMNVMWEHAHTLQAARSICSCCGLLDRNTCRHLISSEITEQPISDWSQDVTVKIVINVTGAISSSNTQFEDYSVRVSALLVSCSSLHECNTEV